MPAEQLTNGKPPVVYNSPAAGDEIRELAIKQVERRHHFRMCAFSVAVGSVVLVIIWAISEYNNAGGWPTEGFSQSSSIPHAWNIWIIYPLLAIGLGVSIDAWNTFRRKPITEAEIRREMDRLKGAG